jgi:hypothetical protein
VDERLAFDPTRRHPADLVPVGFLQALRGAVYRGAQRVRTGPPSKRETGNARVRV